MRYRGRMEAHATDSEIGARRFFSSLGSSGMAATFDVFAGSIQPEDVLGILGKREPLLDLGCGTGRVCLELARRDLECVGLDLVEEFIADANAIATAESLPATFVVGSMLSLPFEDRTFGAAICVWSTFNSLLTAREQSQALAEAHRVLKPEGVLLLDLMAAERSAAGSCVECRVLSRQCQLFGHSTDTISAVLAESPFEDAAVTTQEGGRIRVLARRRPQ